MSKKIKNFMSVAIKTWEFFKNIFLKISTGFFKIQKLFGFQKYGKNFHKIPKHSQCRKVPFIEFSDENT